MPAFIIDGIGIVLHLILLDTIDFLFQVNRDEAK